MGDSGWDGTWLCRVDSALLGWAEEETLTKSWDRTPQKVELMVPSHGLSSQQQRAQEEMDSEKKNSYTK